jgi:hypothetical protein
MLVEQRSSPGPEANSPSLDIQGSERCLAKFAFPVVKLLAALRAVRSLRTGGSQ